MFTHYHPTPLGKACINFTEDAITGITIVDGEQQTTVPATSLIINAAQQLDEYFAGRRQIFDLPLQLTGTPFQQQVWQFLMHIPYAETTSYKQLAQTMQSPLAIRAIAAANAKNKFWIVIPCHRVIGTDGSLTGYAGDLWRKRWLLDHEAKVMGKGGQLTLY